MTRNDVCNKLSEICADLHNCEAALINVNAMDTDQSLVLRSARKIIGLVGEEIMAEFEKERNKQQE